MKYCQQQCQKVLTLVLVKAMLTLAAIINSGNERNSNSSINAGRNSSGNVNNSNISGSVIIHSKMVMLVPVETVIIVSTCDSSDNVNTCNNSGNSSICNNSGNCIICNNSGNGIICNSSDNDNNNNGNFGICNNSGNQWP